jgi:glycogen operon protein
MTDYARPLAQETKEGRSFPLGATLSAEGANFSVYSKHATGIDLLLFDSVDDDRAKRVISIDPATNRTYHYWHVFVPGVKADFYCAAFAVIHFAYQSRQRL